MIQCGLKKTNEIRQGNVMITPYSYMPCDADYFKIKWLDSNVNLTVTVIPIAQPSPTVNLIKLESQKAQLQRYFLE